jgi:hypothetical protein
MVVLREREGGRGEEGGRERLGRRGREKERGRGRGRGRERERQRQRDRETERQRDRETERDRERQRDRETERQRDRDRERFRKRERERAFGSAACRGWRLDEHIARLAAASCASSADPCMLALACRLRKISWRARRAIN